MPRLLTVMNHLRIPAIRRKGKFLSRAVPEFTSHNCQQNWPTWGFHHPAVPLALRIRSMGMRMVIQMEQRRERVSRELVAVVMDDKASQEKEADRHRIWPRKDIRQAYLQSQEEVTGEVMARGHVRIKTCRWL